MLFSDRTSTHYLRSNQLRLYFSSIAYVLMQMLRRLGLAGTELAQAQCSTNTTGRQEHFLTRLKQGLAADATSQNQLAASTD
jgi:hypothetical protein